MLTGSVSHWCMTGFKGLIIYQLSYRSTLCTLDTDSVMKGAAGKECSVI
jgi:hypothetical protein